MILYHGSEKIIENPVYGKGNIRNDYGRGFYCTESEELAKEWACSNNKNGFANKYELNMEGLNVLYLKTSLSKVNLIFHIKINTILRKSMNV